MLLAAVATLLAVLAASAGPLVVAAAPPDAEHFQLRSTRAHAAPLYARADVRSPPGASTDIRVRFELEVSRSPPALGSG